MPVSSRQRAARLPAIRRASFSFSVMCRAGVSAVILLGPVSVTHAQQHTARPAGVLAQTDLTAGFVETASQRFAIPASWIQVVMQVESRGVVRAVSSRGAMGLMQIMPDTWAQLRSRYGLGPDPFDPHDNIIAGTAYLRELLDRYGESGFLAAYNAGPGRYEEHLATGKPLPSETLAYISAITSLPGSAPTEDTNGAAQWASSSFFVEKTIAGFTPSQPSPREPQDRGSTNGIVLTGTAHVPHSDGLFARKSDRSAPP